MTSDSETDSIVKDRVNPHVVSKINRTLICTCGWRYGAGTHGEARDMRKRHLEGV